MTLAIEKKEKDISLTSSIQKHRNKEDIVRLLGMAFAVIWHCFIPFNKSNKAKGISAELLKLNLKNKMEESGKQDETGRKR